MKMSVPLALMIVTQMRCVTTLLVDLSAHAIQAIMEMGKFVLKKVIVLVISYHCC